MVEKGWEWWRWKTKENSGKTDKIRRYETEHGKRLRIDFQCVSAILLQIILNLEH
jgi:hypothetical protein